MVLVDYIGIFVHAPILLATYCISTCILVAVETTMNHFCTAQGKVEVCIESTEWWYNLRVYL